MHRVIAMTAITPPARRAPATAATIRFTPMSGGSIAAIRVGKAAGALTSISSATTRTSARSTLGPPCRKPAETNIMMAATAPSPVRSTASPGRRRRGNAFARSIRAAASNSSHRAGKSGTSAKPATSWKPAAGMPAPVLTNQRPARVSAARRSSVARRIGLRAAKRHPSVPKPVALRSAPTPPPRRALNLESPEPPTRASRPAVQVPPPERWTNASPPPEPLNPAPLPRPLPPVQPAMAAPPMRFAKRPNVKPTLARRAPNNRHPGRFPAAPRSPTVNPSRK